MHHPLSAFNAVLSFAALGCSLCCAQAQPQAPSSDPSQPILKMAQHFEDNLMSLAKAMPADKYNFAPSSELFKPGSPTEFATVRTFAGQLRHVAGEPFRLLAPYGVKPDAAVDPKALDAMTSKDEILNALQACFDYQNKVIASITPETGFTPQGARGMSLVAALLAMFNDEGDHYGQMVEYLRMNGIVPPATERQMQNMHLKQ